MTPQERQLLEDFLNKLASVPSFDKDAEADALIRAQGARQPDALYLSIQRAILLEQAVQGAQQQIQQLEQQVAELKRAQAAAPAQSSRGGFLGALSASAWGRAPQAEAPAESPRAAPSMIGSQIGASAPSPYAAAIPAAANARPLGQAAAAPAAGGGFGGFLGNAAAAAAGVAGGMFLFNGLEHLIGGNQHAADPLASNTPPNTSAVAPEPHAEQPVPDSDPQQLADAGSVDNDDGGWFDDGFFGGGDDDI